MKINSLKKKIIFYSFSLFIFILISHNVPKRITQEDKIYITKIIPTDSKDASEMAFEEQIEYISEIQNIVHTRFELGNPIEYNSKREPKNLFENGSGICYDFSRTLEKVFIYSGFKTRHVSIYFHKKHPANILLLSKSNVNSHSIFEVKTKNGWMIVDTNRSWIALDNKNKTFTIREISKTYKKNKTINWKNTLPKGYEVYYAQPVLSIYGLYSRHGKFYPPYNFIPDYNLGELFFNFIE